MANVRTELPAAGYLREEELKKRTDNLEQAAEEYGVDLTRIDPNKMKVDNELAVMIFDSISISNKQAEYTYRWGNYVAQNGYDVKECMSQRVVDSSGQSVRTWEIVQGDMPEAAEQKGLSGDTTRKVGDVMLLRCRKDVYVLIDRYRRLQRERRERGVSAALEELGEKYRDKGVKVHTNTRMADPAFRREAARAAASGIAREKFNEQLREGTVAGMPAPGIGG